MGLDGSRDKALAYDTLRERARERAAREEERVMYVAMTRARERLILSGGVQVAKWPPPGPASPPLAWLGPALLEEDLTRMATEEEPVIDVRWSTAAVRCSLNAPATVGRVLRTESLAPAGTGLPVAATPAPQRVAAATHDTPPVPRTLSYSALAAWKALRLPLLPRADSAPARGAGHRARG